MIHKTFKEKESTFVQKRLCYGRTLHYEIINSDKLTQEEKEKIYSISIAMNAGEFDGVWTCENFYLDPYDFEPDYFHSSYKQLNTNQVRGIVGRLYAEMIKQGFNRVKVLEGMERQGDIKFLHGDTLGGFVKVGGDEYNALLVLCVLTKITECTKAKISLYDEGSLLYCPIFLKKGLASIDLDAYKGLTAIGSLDPERLNILKLLMREPKWMPIHLVHTYTKEIPE